MKFAYIQQSSSGTIKSTNNVLWKRYLDDIIAIIPENSTNRLFIHLNSINPHIKFTVEEERDRKLPFLDLITRKNDSLSYAVHRKNTHTDNYWNFQSNHPMHHKRDVIKSISDRAKRLCSEDTLGPELNTMGEALAVNGYPRSFIEYVMKNNRNDNIGTNEPIRYVPAPYIKATTERVNKILLPYNVRLGSKVTKKKNKKKNKKIIIIIIII